jgi:C4-type Zn-finger protein
LPNGESQITIQNKRTNEKRIFTSYTEEVYLDELGREIHQPEYSEGTIKEFKNTIRILRMAQVYAQRVDWLISGDDGEESFHERLVEDLDKITEEQTEKDIQEQINYLTKKDED